MDLSSFSAGMGAALVFLALILKFYIPAYLKEKAKNLATKEDISEITEAIEKVRAQYNEQHQTLIHQNNIQLVVVLYAHAIINLKYVKIE